MTSTRSAIDTAVLAHALRAAGQAANVVQMVRTGARFDDVAQQLLASRGSFDALLLRLVERELTGGGESSADAEQVVRVLRVAFQRPGRAPGVASWPAGPLPISERTSS
jgi:DNA-binding FrmR family transcriptional regulator